jgi:transposase
VHVLVNEDGLPLSVVVGPGNEHDRRRFEEVLGGLRVKKSGRGRARTRPKVVYADAAYDAKAIREGLRRRGIRAGIPKNPRRGKGTRGGKRAFRRRKAYRKARSSVERFFGWLKGGFRRLTVRHERRLATFLAFVLLACFLIAWRILRYCDIVRGDGWLWVNGTSYRLAPETVVWLEPGDEYYVQAGAEGIEVLHVVVIGGESAW